VLLLFSCLLDFFQVFFIFFLFFGETFIYSLHQSIIQQVGENNNKKNIPYKKVDNHMNTKLQFITENIQKNMKKILTVKITPEMDEFDIDDAFIEAGLETTRNETYKLIRELSMFSEYYTDDAKTIPNIKEIEENAKQMLNTYCEDQYTQTNKILQTITEEKPDDTPEEEEETPINTRIYFTIKCNEQEIDFYNEYNEEGECNDGYSRNPTSGWTGYTQWHSGWSEQDDTLEETWAAIKEYSRSMALYDLVSSMTQEDINKEYETEYYCEDYVDEKKTYKFTVICYDIEEEYEE